MKLNVQIGSAEFSNPVTVASGTFAYIKKYFSPREFKNLGAIVPKTVTLDPQEGNPPPRICETPAGMLNAIGIDNDGADDFIQNKLPLYASLKVPLIISVSGKDENQFEQLVEKFHARQEIAALELNLSCPNLKKKTLVAQDAEATAQLVKKMKRISRLPVIAKLTPNVTDIVEIAVAAETAGADGVSLVNTFAAMAIDARTRRPVLGNVTGGLSGPAIKPIALRMVHQVAQKVKIPLVAMGGIMTAEDAIEFLIAGATMVATGTVNFIEPKAPMHILKGIKAYMRKHNMQDIRELIGCLEV